MQIHIVLAIQIVKEEKAKTTFLLLLRTDTLGIEVVVRVQVTGPGVVRPQGDDGAERQVARHGRVVERVADESRLEERAEVPVTVPAGIKIQM